eukprot:CAMPEP_0204278354 /NCGR_PEP_ID=MMETSP0468-20130131/29819_1 /ASSEMBLY_ACC=CAM_ASM_000383 /TAXON_ID=2969 /ORGANISM="Oxyrrhis marina" /LENGTH=266 /DNA_ID=CAMNT_0051255251 /DNA_START=39 /DNA_END=837 /DNA_ORIENTATION=-
MTCRATTCLANEDLGEASTDLQGLLAALTNLAKSGVSFTEVHYVVNWWTTGEGGMWLPLKHHGVVLQGSPGPQFLSLDFSRKGIVWDLDTEMPEMPDYTCVQKAFPIHANPMDVAEYCSATKEFDFFSNDCSKWTSGLMKDVLKVDIDSGKSLKSEVETEPAPQPPAAAAVDSPSSRQGASASARGGNYYASYQQAPWQQSTAGVPQGYPGSHGYQPPASYPGVGYPGVPQLSSGMPTSSQGMGPADNARKVLGRPWLQLYGWASC